MDCVRQLTRVRSNLRKQELATTLLKIYHDEVWPWVHDLETTPNSKSMKDKSEANRKRATTMILFLIMNRFDTPGLNLESWPPNGNLQTSTLDSEAILNRSISILGTSSSSLRQVPGYNCKVPVFGDFGFGVTTIDALKQNLKYSTIHNQVISVPQTRPNVNNATSNASSDDRRSFIISSNSGNYECVNSSGNEANPSTSIQPVHPQDLPISARRPPRSSSSVGVVSTSSARHNPSIGNAVQTAYILSVPSPASSHAPYASPLPDAHDYHCMNPNMAVGSSPSAPYDAYYNHSRPAAPHGYYPSPHNQQQIAHYNPTPSSPSSVHNNPTSNQVRHNHFITFNPPSHSGSRKRPHPPTSTEALQSEVAHMNLIYPDDDPFYVPTDTNSDPLLFIPIAAHGGPKRYHHTITVSEFPTNEQPLVARMFEIHQSKTQKGKYSASTESNSLTTPPKLHWSSRSTLTINSIPFDLGKLRANEKTKTLDRYLVICPKTGWNPPSTSSPLKQFHFKFALAFSLDPQLAYVFVVHKMKSNSVSDLVNQFINCPSSRISYVEGKEKVKRSFITKGNDELSIDMQKLQLHDTSLSLARIEHPVRAKNCAHIDCFDLEKYLALNQRTPFWKCPICKVSAPFPSLVLDDYIRDALQAFPKEREVVITSDGSTHAASSYFSFNGNQQNLTLISSVSNQPNDPSNNANQLSHYPNRSSNGYISTPAPSRPISAHSHSRSPAAHAVIELLDSDEEEEAQELAKNKQSGPTNTKGVESNSDKLDTSNPLNNLVLASDIMPSGLINNFRIDGESTTTTNTKDSNGMQVQPMPLPPTTAVPSQQQQQQQQQQQHVKSPSTSSTGSLPSSLNPLLSASTKTNDQLAQNGIPNLPSTSSPSISSNLHNTHIVSGTSIPEPNISNDTSLAYDDNDKQVRLSLLIQSCPSVSKVYGDTNTSIHFTNEHISNAMEGTGDTTDEAESLHSIGTPAFSPQVTHTQITTPINQNQGIINPDDQEQFEKHPPQRISIVDTDDAYEENVSVMHPIPTRGTLIINNHVTTPPTSSDAAMLMHQASAGSIPQSASSGTSPKRQPDLRASQHAVKQSQALLPSSSLRISPSHTRSNGNSPASNEPKSQIHQRLTNFASLFNNSNKKQNATSWTEGAIELSSDEEWEAGPNEEGFL